jgi:hypothetical protein
MNWQYKEDKSLELNLTPWGARISVNAEDKAVWDTAICTINPEGEFTFYDGRQFHALADAIAWSEDFVFRLKADLV